MTNLSLASPVPEKGEEKTPIHAPFEPRVLIAIDAALRQAWAGLCADKASRLILESKGEVAITHRLRKQLNVLRISGGVAGYNTAAFERPYSGAEYQNYKGEEVRKPDLIFALAGDPRPGVFDDLYDAVFVECKLIDQASSKNVGRYCSNGLIRFVEGSYAWRMPHGMMLAYVRSGQYLPDALTNGLNSYGRAQALNTDGNVRLCSLSVAEPRVCLTDHERSWLLPEGQPPGRIQVRHLWLSVYA